VTIDHAQRVVDETQPDDLVWGGSLAPPSSLRDSPDARANSRNEIVVERGAIATVFARLRFLHLTYRIGYERRHDGTWAPAVQHDLEPSEEHMRKLVVVDVQVPMADLIEGLWSHHFAVVGSTTTRELGPPRDESRLIELISHPVNGVIELRADPLSGPHGLIRLLVRVRNTTEPLVDIPGHGAVLAHSMVGCHVIVALDKGKFLSTDQPPLFAEPFVAMCENENSRQVILDGSAKVLLATVAATPG
jgi:hypothetical protein